MNEMFPDVWYGYLNIFAVFVRVLGLMILLPVFSHRSIPGTVKVLLALALAFALFPVVRTYLGPTPETLGGLVLLVLRESVIGFMMGFIVYITFEAINLAAQYLGYQMGFGVVSLVDPQTQDQVSVLVPLHWWLAVMIFLIADMHHEILFLLVKSYEITSGSGIEFLANKPLFDMVIGLVGRFFSLSVQIAAPLCLLILLCNVAIGILARLLPQLNVLLFSFPITITLGIVAIYVIAPDLLNYLDSILGDVSSDVMLMLKTI